MKLERYKDKKETRRKVMLIGLTVMTIVSVTMLLFKSFANFRQTVSFPIMSGKVKYSKNGDIIFAFYNGSTQLTDMPQKGNTQKLGFDHGNCDNGATVEWDDNKWAPTVLSLTTTKTTCNLYFKVKEGKDLGSSEIPPVESTDGLLAVSPLSAYGLPQEYRYAGATPNNYVTFNSETWRIIGKVNVKTTSGKIEQRIKIIRNDSLGLYSWDGSYSGKPNTNNWLNASLKTMLNGIYYNSGNGECYKSDKYDYSAPKTTCDFSSNGLKDSARQMIDDSIVWTLGGWTPGSVDSWHGVESADTLLPADLMYINERSTFVYSGNPTEWSKLNDSTYHKGVGLMYPSDYEYAVGGTIRNECLNNDVNSSTNNCYKYNWLYSAANTNGADWSQTPTNLDSYSGFYISQKVGICVGCGDGTTSTSEPRNVRPVVYLKPNVTIYSGDGSSSSPFQLKLT